MWPQGLPQGDPRQLGFSPERLGRIGPLLQREVDTRQFAGIQAMLARHGKVAYSGSFGYQDVASSKPMRPDTIVRLHSTTTLITSIAAMSFAGASGSVDSATYKA